MRMQKDFIYILVNNLNPAYCKIGVSNDVEKRIDKLYGDWKLYKKIKTDKSNYYEQQIKTRMRDFVVCGFEMFNCPVTYLDKIANEEMNKVEAVDIPERAISINGNVVDIAKLVRDTRKQQGMTQEVLAGASRTGVRLIVDIEKGKKTCEIGKVLHILNMLGLQLYVSTKKWF